MSADLSVPAPAVVARHPGTVLARLTAHRSARSATVWGLVFGAYVASSALGYAATYKTPLARSDLAATFGTNVGFNALIGSAHQIGTVAGFTAWRSLGVLSIVGGVWGVLVSTRLLRGEEDAGRWEMMLTGQTTRARAAAQAVAGLAGGLAALWAVTAVITVVVGQDRSVDIGVGPALFLSLALVSSAAIFLTGGALASQLAPTRRQAAGYAAAALGGSFVLRMIADSGTGLPWLRWVSPLGWVEELRPLTSPQPLALLPIVALVGATAVGAILLAGSRDLGASVIADRPSAKPRTRLLSGSAGLTVRLTRGVVTAWGISIALLGLLMGLIAASVGSVLSQNVGDRQAFDKMGFRGTGAEQYLAITLLIVALLAALLAAGQVSAARGEEADGRVDHLVVRPLSRWRWLGGRIAVASGSVLLVGVAAGLTSWLGAASQGTGISLATLLDAGLNVVPAAILILGAGTLAFGMRPRATSSVTYGLIAWSFLVEVTGGVVNASHWLLDTSVFHQMAAAPSVRPNWTSGVVMLALGAAAAAGGAVAFRHRDLAAE